jgi:alcohol dehydrogenase
LDGRSYALVTSKGWLTRSAVDDLESRSGAPSATVTVAPNPTFRSVSIDADALQGSESIVALGGGSVLDAAKAMAVVVATSRDTLEEHLLGGLPLPSAMTLPMSVAVPTTSGTGSEVTRWGTIWGENGAKHSVSDAQLYADYAVLDPMLCALMPRSLSLSTGLDALSHAMEAVWNKHHVPIADALATQTIALVRLNLGRAMAAPDDLAARQAMQTAAVLGGLAMGTTQTAISHSISYPFTSAFGLPHGLACSFALAECARFNSVEDPQRLAPIAAGLGCRLEQIPSTIEDWFEDLGLGSALAAFDVGPQSVDLVANQLINPARAANNIRPVTNAEAEKIVRAALGTVTKAQ